MSKDTKEIVVLSVGGFPKGIVTAEQFKRMTKKWWHEAEMIEVPLADWNNDKVRIDTIQKYIKAYFDD